MNNPLPTRLEAPGSAAEQIRLRMDFTLVTRAHIVCIGLGGIGLWLVDAVATFLQGLLRADASDDGIYMLLVDGDTFTPENSYRMDVPEYGNKAEVVGHRLLERWRDTPLVVRWCSEFIDADNVTRLIGDGDVVLLACDNHKTRHVVNRHCSQSGFENIVLISGGNDGVEDGLRGTFGNVQVYWRRDGQDRTAPLDRFHPEIAQPADRAPHEMGCVELAASGVPQLTLANLAVASSMANALLRLLMPIPQESMFDELSLDILDAVSHPHFLSVEPPHG
jgi:molybdopterin/thiamine biosynthesis adenylyltransferase